MTINWEQQWALHAPDFRNGAVHIHVNNKTLMLKPGPGFGDLSHPTTRLMINLIKSNPLHKVFIDIGSGSGVLSLIAKALGVKTVIGIEIDPEAIVHARCNADKNQLDIAFVLPEAFSLPKHSEPVTIAMNMIELEQLQAWDALPMLHSLKGNCLISGILKEGEQSYLKQAKKWGWTHLSTYSEAGWLAFHFVR